MRILPSGSTALLVELDDLDQVLTLYAALSEDRPDGVINIVPAGRTILLVVDSAITDLAALKLAIESTRPRLDLVHISGEPVEIPVVYDGEDLPDVADSLGCDIPELVRRHTDEDWTVAFCGFAPGFGYLVGGSYDWNTPRRESPRTSVPAGAVALAGEFSGVYPRSSPGGWQLIGHSDLTIFDLESDPPALLRPGTPVRFVNVGDVHDPT